MIKIKDNDSFKKAIEQISTFVDDCNIRVNEYGITIKAFDLAQMLYIEYNLSNEGIEGELESTIVGVNISELNKVISKSNGTIMFEFSQNDIVLSIDGEYKREYIFPLKELNEKELAINVDDYNANAKIKGHILRDIFASAKLVSDSMIIDCNEELKHFNLIADGVYGKYKTTITGNTNKTFKTRYSTSYLNNMVRSAIDGDVEIFVDLTKPLYISYALNDNKFKFFLAPMFI